MKALILIDIQKGLTCHDLYEEELFFTTINRAIKEFRQSKDMIIFVQHEDKNLTPNTTPWEIDGNLLLEPTDLVFGKQKGNAFTNKDLVSMLNEKSITDITIGGLVSHACIKAGCKGSVELGYTTSLLKGGHSCWNTDAALKIETTEKILTEIGVKLINL